MSNIILISILGVLLFTIVATLVYYAYYDQYDDKVKDDDDNFISFF